MVASQRFTFHSSRNETFELDRDLSDGQWHNLVVTAFPDEKIEISLDGEFVENRTLPVAGIYFKLGGSARIGFTEGENGMRLYLFFMKF